MKKFIIALVLALSCLSNARAEKTDSVSVSDSTDTTTSYFGIKIGWIVDAPRKMNANGNRLDCFTGSPGVEIGGIYHLQLSRNFYFEPEIGLYYKWLQTMSDFYNRYMDNGHMDIIGWNMSLNVGLLKRYHKCSFFVKTGPQFDMGIYGKEKAYFLKEWGERVDQNAYKSLNRYNVLWNIGFGVSQRRVTMGVDWAIGLTDFVSKYNINAKNKVFKLYIGYNF